MLPISVALPLLVIVLAGFIGKYIWFRDCWIDDMSRATRLMLYILSEVLSLEYDMLDTSVNCLRTKPHERQWGYAILSYMEHTCFGFAMWLTRRIYCSLPFNREILLLGLHLRFNECNGLCIIYGPSSYFDLVCL